MRTKLCVVALLLAWPGVASALVCRDLDKTERESFNGYVEQILELRKQVKKLEVEDPKGEALRAVFGRMAEAYQSLGELCGPSPDIEFNLARVQDKAGLCREAMVGYARLSKGDPSKSDVWASVVSRSRRRYDELYPICTFPVRIECADPEATIKIDGEAATTCPTTVNFAVGNHKIVSERTGYVTGQKSFRVELDTKSVKVDALERVPAAREDARFAAALWVTGATGLASGELYTAENVSFGEPRALEGISPGLLSLVVTPEVSVPVAGQGSVVGRLRVDVTHLSVSGSVAWRQPVWVSGSSAKRRAWVDAGLGFGTLLLPVGRDDVIYLNRTGPVAARLGFGVSWWDLGFGVISSGVDAHVGVPDFGVVLDVSLIGVRAYL